VPQGSPGVTITAAVAADHKGLAANAERRAADGKTNAAKAAEIAATAKNAVERLKKGEGVSGFEKTFTREQCSNLSGSPHRLGPRYSSLTGLPGTGLKRVESSAIQPFRKRL
jgi:hypothetical protein